jgi:hypothetical protein
VGSTVSLNALREKKNSPPLPEIAPQSLLLSLLPGHYADYATPVPRPNIKVFKITDCGKDMNQ